MGSSALTDDIPKESDYPEMMRKAKEQITRDFGPPLNTDAPVDPTSVHAFFAPLYVGTYAAYRESVVTDGVLPRSKKEIIGAFVSKSNECVYCAHSHTRIAATVGADDPSLWTAVTNGKPSLIRDEKLKNICTWLYESQHCDAQVLQEVPPFSTSEMPEILAVAFHFNYINRIVDQYITQDTMLPIFPQPVMTVMRAVPFMKDVYWWWKTSFFLSKTAGSKKPGESIPMMGYSATLPSEFDWARENESVAQAHAYWNWAIIEMGEKYIAKEIRDYVGKYIVEHYTGHPAPVSKRWASKVADESHQSEANCAAIRFMLLISFGRHQIDGSVRSDLKTHFPRYDVCRAMGMWSAFHTAKVIAQWQYAAIAKFGVELKERRSNEL